jgi:hypothetical protein
VFEIAQRRRFGVDLRLAFARVSVMQNIQALGVGGHNAVFDAVVDHLDEVSGAVLATVQVSALGGADDLLPPRRARSRVDLRSERSEDRIQVLDDVVIAANHMAEAALQTPDAAAGVSLGAGMALGREGPTIQLGGNFGKMVADRFKLPAAV